MTKEENIKAILECNFAGFKEEIINIAAKRICELEQEPMIEIDLYSVIKQKYIEREVLDKISTEVKALSPEPTAYDVIDGNPVKDAVWETIGEVLQIIDKYREESEVKANENEK